MTEHFTVLCLKWGNKYGPEYVNILYSMIERNTTIPFRFVCITDKPKGLRSEVETKPIIMDEMRGWWQKLSFFKDPLYDITGTVLTLDLDIVIVNNIDDIVNTEGDFCISKDQVPRNGFNSSVMKFEAGNHSDIVDDFNIKVKDICTGEKGEKLTRKKYWGDQVWITEKRPNATLWPDESIISYKRHCTDHGKKSFSIPGGAKILIFHGKPDPHEVLPHIERWWNED